MKKLIIALFILSSFAFPQKYNVYQITISNYVTGEYNSDAVDLKLNLNLSNSTLKIGNIEKFTELRMMGPKHLNKRIFFAHDPKTLQRVRIVIDELLPSKSISFKITYYDKEVTYFCN